MNSYWWLVPKKLVIFLITPIISLVIFFHTASDGGQYLLGEDAIDSYSIFIILLFLLFLVLGTTLPRNSALAASMTPNLINHALAAHRKKHLKTTFFIATVAHILWLGPIFFKPQLLDSILQLEAGFSHYVRREVETIPGITTFTQASFVFSCMYGYFYYIDKIDRTDRIMLIILSFIIIIRVIVWSERLAIIEFILPISMAYILKTTPSKKTQTLINLLPLIGILALYFGFTATEYIRSWNSYYSEESTSLLRFTAERLTSYYSIALNNAALVVKEYGIFNTPIYSFSWLFNLPVIGDIVSQNITDKIDHMVFLDAFANPELNNTSPILTTYFEFGPLYIFYPLALGFLSQKLYESYRKLEFYSFLTFPITFISILEIVRINYLFSVKTIPVYVVIIFIIVSDYRFFTRHG